MKLKSFVAIMVLAVIALGATAYAADVSEISERVEELLGISNLGIGSRVVTVKELPELDNALLINFVAQDNFTSGMIETGIWNDALDILLDVAPRVSNSNIVVGATFPVTDKYGNNKMSLVGYMDVTRAEVLKINKKNFFGDDIPKIANLSLLNLKGLQ